MWTLSRLLHRMAAGLQVGRLGKEITSSKQKAYWYEKQVCELHLFFTEKISEIVMQYYPMTYERTHCNSDFFLGLDVSDII